MKILKNNFSVTRGIPQFSSASDFPPSPFFKDVHETGFYIM